MEPNNPNPGPGFNPKLRDGQFYPTTGNMKQALYNKQSDMKLSLRKKKLEDFLEAQRKNKGNFSFDIPASLSGKYSALVSRTKDLRRTEDENIVGTILGYFENCQLPDDLFQAISLGNIGEMSDILSLYLYIIGLNDYDILEHAKNILDLNYPRNIFVQMNNIIESNFNSDIPYIQCLKLYVDISYLDAEIITKVIRFPHLIDIILKCFGKIREKKVYGQYEVFLICSNYIIECQRYDDQEMNNRFLEIKNVIFPSGLFSFFTEVLLSYQADIPFVIDAQKDSYLTFLLHNLYKFFSVIKVFDLVTPEMKEEMERFLSGLLAILDLFSFKNNYNLGQSKDGLKYILSILCIVTMNDDYVIFLIYSNFIIRLNNLLECLLYSNEPLQVARNNQIYDFNPDSNMENRKKKEIILENMFDIVTCYNHIFSESDDLLNQFINQNVILFLKEIIKKYKVPDIQIRGIQTAVLSCLSNFCAIKGNEETNRFFKDNSIVILLLNDYVKDDTIGSCLDLLENIFLIHDLEVIQIFMQHNFWRIIQNALRKNQFQARALVIISRMLSNSERVQGAPFILEKIEEQGLIPMVNDIATNSTDPNYSQYLNEVNQQWNTLIEKYHIQ